MKSSLLESLFDQEERRPLTVSELNEQVKSALERSFASVWLEGEIVNFIAANRLRLIPRTGTVRLAPLAFAFPIAATTFATQA